MKYEYRILDENEVMRIHEVSLRVLSDPGMKVLDDDLCAILARKGLPVDGQAGQIVRFPQDMVDAAIAAAPKRFSMFDHERQ